MSLARQLARGLRGARHAAALAGLLFLSACVYFNGIYNAREAQRSADKRARGGHESEAAGQYQVMAEKAESVLTRYPRSKWRGEALYLAGRGHALSGQCVEAVPRLTEFLALPARPREQRERASLALGICLVRQEHYVEGRGQLESLVGAPAREVAQTAAVWAARAAMALGDNDGAAAYLARVDAAQAQWELAAASLEAGDYARAESLYALRAARGDWRDEAEQRLTDLWMAGRRDAVEALARRWGDSRAPAGAKARLHLLVGSLQMAAGDARSDSLARAHLVTAMRVAGDTTLDREIAARLTRLNLRAVRSVADVEGTVKRYHDRARGHPLQASTEESALLLRILEHTPDGTGATLFLAAEVARDSLEARLVARQLFYRVATDFSTNFLAPRALVAAAELWPDSAATFRERVRTRYPQSPYALFLSGAEGGAAQAWLQVRQGDAMLQDAWEVALRAFGDSVQALHPSAPQQQASAPNGPPP